MEISIKWKDCGDGGRPVWRDVPLSSLECFSRDHAVLVLNYKLPVVVREGDCIISNDMEMRNLYRKKGNKVTTFEDVKPSSVALGSVGFLS